MVPVLHSKVSVRTGSLVHLQNVFSYIHRPTCVRQDCIKDEQKKSDQLINRQEPMNLILLHILEVNN